MLESPTTIPAFQPTHKGKGGILEGGAINIGGKPELNLKGSLELPTFKLGVNQGGVEVLVSVKGD